jgi:hypothetical protein
MLAVLEDAVYCYLHNMNQTNRRASLEFCEVSDWFSARNCHDLFVFENICNVLGIDPGWVRRGLRVMRAEAESGAREAQSASHSGLPRRVKTPGSSGRAQPRSSHTEVRPDQRSRLIFAGIAALELFSGFVPGNIKVGVPGRLRSRLCCC